MTRSQSDVLIGPRELKRRLGEAKLTLLDVRWALGAADGRAQFAEGHIPGAVYVDLETELAGEPSRSGGRHPLPSLEALQTAARRWGVRRDATVVAYDDAGNTAAARAWWLLRWGGLTDVLLLDGGLGAWRRAGLALENGEEAPASGDVELSPGHLPVLDADGAAALAANGLLLDARAAERYRGEIEPVDPVAGHIPSAISAPTTENLTAEGTFAAREALVDRFSSLGVDGSREVGVYCGSGVTAAHEIAALTIAGFPDAALYAGSWSQWCADPARPVATLER